MYLYVQSSIRGFYNKVQGVVFTVDKRFPSAWDTCEKMRPGNAK